MDITNDQDQSKNCQIKTVKVKRDTFQKKQVFLKIQLHVQLLSKVLPSHIFFMHHSFFNPTIGKPTAPAYQNTLTFDQYLYNSMSNIHVNLVYWNSLHPKIAILPTFSGQNPHFLSEKQKTRSNNLHHRKAESFAVILSLLVGVQHIQKVVQ